MKDKSLTLNSNSSTFEDKMEPYEPYGIVVVEENYLVRRAIKNIIQRNPSLHVVAETDNSLELPGLLCRIRADMVILDIAMHHPADIEVLSNVRKLFPAVKVVVLTIDYSRLLYCHATAIGVQGYLMKNDPDSELLKAISIAREGRRYISLQMTP